jgi:hypothetical protein
MKDKMVSAVEKIKNPSLTNGARMGYRLLQRSLDESAYFKAWRFAKPPAPQICL